MVMVELSYVVVVVVVVVAAAASWLKRIARLERVFVGCRPWR